jgi:Terminase large subunit, T4likevirus-type, N-terminal
LFKTEQTGGKVKPAGFVTPYTAEQAYEVAIKCPSDPVYFIEKYCWILSTEGRMLFKLYQYQRKLLRHYVDHAKTVTLLARQSGKTESAAAFLLWWAIFKPDQKILIASYKADAAKAIMKRLKFMYEELPWWIKPGVKLPGGWNVMSVEFENGSQIIAETTTGNTGRGYSINLFYLDEFAYVHPSIADEFWTSIFPTISSSESCRCIITSTANTDEDKFAQIWFNSIQSKWSYDTSYTMRIREEDMEPAAYDTFYETEDVRKDEEERMLEDNSVHGFYRFHAPWTEKPGRGEAFKQGILKSGYTETEWKRDFECQFLTRNETLISPAKLLALNNVVRPPRFVDKWGMRWYEEIRPGTTYGVMLDPSEGVERDDACIQVWEFPALLQVAEWNSNLADQADQAKMLYRTIRRIYKIQQNDPDHDGKSNIYYSVECNGIGLGILNALEIEYEYKIPGYLIDSVNNKLRGIRMTTSVKKECALEMAALIERNVFIPRSRHLVSQFKNFVRKRESVYCAKEGSKDDLVMSCILMMQLVEELKLQEPDLQERLMMEITDMYDTSEEEELYGTTYKPFAIIG